jgi:TIR domain
MPYVKGYANDIFVSYAHADNDAADGQKPWVSGFVDELKRSLTRRLGGEKPAFYYDLSGFSTGRPLRELLDNVCDSALFLTIASPSYLNREWTTYELQTFNSAQGETSRLFPVEVLPLDSDQEWPPELAIVKRAKFWTPEGDAQTPVTIQSDIHRKMYFVQIEALANEFKDKLKIMASEGGPANVRFETIPKTRGGSGRRGSISGRVFGLQRPTELKVVIYSRIKKWYVQPFRSTPFTNIDEHGLWSNRIRFGDRYAALAVHETFIPQSPLIDLPIVEGNILGRAEVSAS